MKGGQNLRTLQQARKDIEPEVKPRPCMECGKVIGAPYGRWRNGWSCSKKCELLIKEKEHV